MKAVIVKAHGDYKVGEQAEIKAEEFEVLNNSGIAVTPSEWASMQSIKASEAATIKAREARVDAAILQAQKDERIAPKADTTVIRAHALTMESVNEGVGVEFLLNLPVKAKDLSERLTHAVKDNYATEGLSVTASIEDCAQGVIKATEPQNNLIKSGNWKQAAILAKEAGLLLKNRLITPVIKAGGDYMLRNTVKAATLSDPDSQVGSLAGDLVIMRNLGYLVAKLPWIKKLTTDMTGEPAKFGQPILTRYVTPPDVLTWVPGVGFTSQANQISDSGTGTTQSGGLPLRTEGAGNQALDATNIFGIAKKSVPSTTDRTVTMNMFKATEVEFPVSLLASTVRSLFGEQLGAQTYSLAEEINKHVLGMFALPTAAKYSTGVAWGTGGTAGLTYSYTKAIANWNLAGVIGIKNKMSIARIPDIGRFALLHSFYHDKLLEDSNLLSAKAIMALLHKNEAEFNTGEIPTLFGVQPLESQLASWRTDTGALTTWVDDTTLGTTDAVGFAGNASSGMFVSRPPQDFTNVATQLGIPVTASIRLMTEPDSGLTVMVFSYLDNGKMAIMQRVCLMYGAAQGDPRQGIVIKAA